MYSSEYQHTYFGAEFVDNLKKVRDSLVIPAPIDMLSDSITKELIEVEEKDRFIHSEF